MIIFVNVTPELEKSKDNSKEIEDATESLRKQLFIEKSLKTQAVNKLAEIMCRKDFMLLQRENSKKRKATADDLRKKEKECRKLHQELGAVSWHIAYRPLLSYLLPRCQSEASCETILMKVVPPSGSSSWKSNSFSYSWFCAKPRFETEADFNSEMAYSILFTSLEACHIRVGPTKFRRSVVDLLPAQFFFLKIP